MGSPTIFETNDMGLATYLAIKGFEYGTYWKDLTHWWVFQETDECTRWIDLWMTYNASVEPREYNRIFGRLKGELMATHPDHNRRWSGRQQGKAG